MAVSKPQPKIRQNQRFLCLAMGPTRLDFNVLTCARLLSDLLKLTYLLVLNYKGRIR